MNRYRIHENHKKVQWLEGGFFKGQILRLVKERVGDKGFPEEIELVNYEPRYYPPEDKSPLASQFPRFKVKDLSKQWFNKTYIHAVYLLQGNYYEQI